MTDAAIKRIAAELEAAYGDDVREYVIDQSLHGSLERVGYYGAFLIWREIEADVREQVAQTLFEICGPDYSPIGDPDALEDFKTNAVDSVIDFDESFDSYFERKEWMRHYDLF